MLLEGADKGLTVREDRWRSQKSATNCGFKTVDPTGIVVLPENTPELPRTTPILSTTDP